MLERSEWPGSIDDLAKYMLEAVSEAKSVDTGTEPQLKYQTKARALANVSAAAFLLASELMGADESQQAYAQALFLHATDMPCANFRIVYGDDLLIPGQIEANFTMMDEWYSHLEHTIMPARARALLQHFGDDIDTDTRELWEILSKKDRS